MTRTKALARVAAVYGQMERLRLVELQAAAAAVAEAEGLRGEAELAGEAQKGEGRAALARGEGVAWRLAESACEAAGAAALRAGVLRDEREALRAGAGDVYRASRLQAEQAAGAVEGLRQVEAIAAGRREQAATDDRYAARLCWSRMKAG